MPRPRLDPASRGAPIVGAAVSNAVYDRITALAEARGVTRSVVIRELLEIGLAALDAAAGLADVA